jgi:hypothetical protein
VDRRLVGAPHQLADVLQLPVAGAVRGDPLVLAHGGEDVLGQFDALQLGG